MQLTRGVAVSQREQATLVICFPDKHARVTLMDMSTLELGDDAIIKRHKIGHKVLFQLCDTSPEYGV